VNARRDLTPEGRLSDDVLVLRAGELQRYLAQHETYETETFFDDVSVVETRVDPHEPVHFRGRLTPTYDGVIVSGALTATWVAPCRRCNTEVRSTVNWEFSELFSAKAVEGESYPLGDESLDLRPMVRDQVTLQLPLAPVCREDCAGICSVCGVDLNVSDCDCASDAPDPRWDVLKDLDLG